MSKAKELAREILNQIDTGSLLKIQPNINMVEELCYAVLSEPDEQDGLKGWIDVGETPYRQLVHLNSGKVYEEFLGSPERVRVQGYGGYIDINSTFDNFKQKIKESL